MITQITQERNATIQKHEINARIDWLRDHLRRFEKEDSRTAAALRAAWTRELCQKRALLLDLVENKPLARSDVSVRTNEPLVLMRERVRRELR